MERRAFSFVFCLLWASVTCFEHCEKVFNCAADTKTHPFDMEFCPNRFPSSSNIDFTHLAANLSKGLPYPLNSAIGYVEIYSSDSPTPIYSGSKQYTCEQLKKQAPFIPTCPIPAHIPFSKSAAYNLTTDFKIPADHYKIHLEINNEKQDLELCMEVSIEVYDADTPPDNGPTTPYVPIMTVIDPGEEKAQKPVDRPAYTVPVVTNGEPHHRPEAHKQQGGDTSVAPTMSSGGIWVVGTFLLSFVIAAY